MAPVRRGFPASLPLVSKVQKQPKDHIQTPEKVLHRYLIWHESEGHSRKTEENYRKTLRPFFTYLANEQDIADINSIYVDHVRAWLVWLRNMPSAQGKPRSSKTIETYCRQVMAFLHWCVEEEIIDHNPLERLKLPKAEKKIIRVFSNEEVKNLHEVCIPPSNGLRPDVRRMLTARNRAILWVLLDTGMRESELCGMRFMDFDRKHGTVYIMGKGAKERKVLLGQRGYHYLTSYLDHWRGDPDSQEEFLILTDSGEVITPQTVQKLFMRLKKLSGIADKRVSAHTCRHWYAISFLKKGGKLFALQRHLGHETLDMVKIYAYFTDNDAEEEKRKFSPADDVELETKKVARRGFRQG